MDELKADENTKLSFEAREDFSLFISNFNIGNVNTKIFILLLAFKHPRSLISNSKVNLSDVLLRCNRNEFHHIFPKATLIRDGEKQPNLIAKFCFLSNADNQAIKDKRPAEYYEMTKSEMRDDIFRRALLPRDWQTMEYGQFLTARLAMIHVEMMKLAGRKDVGEDTQYRLFYRRVVETMLNR